MEVESTHVHIRPDGKKLIDVTLRRQGVPPRQVGRVPCGMTVQLQTEVSIKPDCFARPR